MWVKYTHFSHGKTAPKIYRQWRRSSTFHSCWVDVWRVILFYGLQGGNPMNLVFKSCPFEYLLGILCYFGFLSCVLVCTSFCVISWCLISFHVIAVHCICSYLYLNRYIYIHAQVLSLSVHWFLHLFINSFIHSFVSCLRGRYLFVSLVLNLVIHSSMVFWYCDSLISLWRCRYHSSHAPLSWDSDQNPYEVH